LQCQRVSAVLFPRPSVESNAHAARRGLTRIKATGVVPVSTGGPMANDAPSREQRDREAFFAQLSRYMSGLYRYAQHLLRYYQTLGDLPAGQIDTDDIVDTAVLGAYRELGKGGAERDLRTRLMRIARSYVQNEVRRMIARRELTIRKEEDVPETPPEEDVSLLGEQIFEFFEPDEDLKVEDVVPDLDVPTPEQAVETAEWQQCVNSALAGMPAEWRRALMLRFGRGLKGGALAQALGKPESETSLVLERARAYLRQRLVEAGCSFTPQSDPAASLARSPAKPT
jgi:RNA polymerase sigma factor (sigma-70 family)